MIPRRRLFGLDFADVTLADAADEILALASRSRSLPALVVTPNVDHLVSLDRNPALQRIYASADLVLADGMPLVWVSRLLGRPLRARVTGADLVPALAGRSTDRRLRLFLLGGQPGAAARAAINLSRRNPTMPDPGVLCPPIGFERDERANQEVLAVVNAFRPDILFVALGSPKQEMWIDRHRRSLATAVCIGVGAALDFASGMVRRAPPALQRLGLEWAFRMTQDPRLIARYLIRDSHFVRLLAREARQAIIGG
jgi:N-acetylglucosaminyldiphosphoundecaprenol N-acetyl-beta-D-mannosaminyltransferase